MTITRLQSTRSQKHPIRRLIERHRELLKFVTVGGCALVADVIIFYSLSFTVLENKPAVAKMISGLAATIFSYFPSRYWVFDNRGGRKRRHEAGAFFLVSGIGIVLQALPLLIVNNIFSIRGSAPTTHLVILDFALSYVVGNVLQMIFRFWALRRFAFPEEGRE